MINSRESLLSIIDDGSDIKSSFGKIIKHFDPNKKRNKKTKVLDLSNLYLWDEKDYSLFFIDKTHNIDGSIKDNMYDIIVYEPPKNNQFITQTTNYSKKFTDILNKQGIVIVKVNDYREKDSLKGCFDIWDIFDQSNFYLHDNIICKNKYEKFFDDIDNNRCKIVHFNFMIFKKKQTPDKN